MKEEIKIFENAQFGQIRTAVSESGEPLFCLADVCKALDLQQVSKLRQRLNSKGVHTIPLLTNGGTQRAYFNIYNVSHNILKNLRKKPSNYYDYEENKSYLCGVQSFNSMAVCPSVSAACGHFYALQR